LAHLSILFIAFSALAATTDGPPPQDQLTQWIRENALVLSDLDAQRDYPQLGAFDNAIRGKRIVFLGEASHWVHEKYDYRLILLKRLIANGFTTIGMEMGVSDGRRVDQFLASGDPKDLDRLALYGYESRAVRSRPTTGACPVSRQMYAGLPALFKDEESWFYSQLRGLGVALLPKGERVRHFGFDLDTVPGGAYEDIDDLLRAGDQNALVARLRNLMEIRPGESADDELRRLQTALNYVDQDRSALASMLTDDVAKKIRLSLHVLIESIRFIAYESSRPCDPAKVREWNLGLLSAMTARERVMFEIMKATLDDLGPDAKIVLMGHDFHLSKEPRSLRFANATVADPNAPKMWPSIGEYISKTLAIPTYAVWMIESEGTQSNIDCETRECRIATGQTYLGHLLAPGGPVYLLPLLQPLDRRASVLDRRASFATNGGTYSGNVIEAADAIFFVERVSGLKPRRGQAR
jgi:erythromycin esterase-like protein